jgi:hypothetical protein
VHKAAPLLALAALAGCEEARTFVAAECGDGTRIAGVREAVESRCARRGGVRALAPLTNDDPPAENETGS